MSLLSILVSLAFPVSLAAAPQARQGEASSPQTTGEEAAAGDDSKAEPETPDLVETVIRLAELPLERLWPELAALEPRYRNGQGEALARLAAKIHDLNEGARLAGAKVLVSASGDAQGEKGQVELERLAREAASKDVRLAAIRLLADPLPSMWEEAIWVLNDLAYGAEDPEIRIEASVSLWELDNYPEHRKPLSALLEDDDPKIRYAAALALAETGYLDPPVEEILEQLRGEPSERGKRAALLLRLQRTERDRTTTPRVESKDRQPPGAGGTRPAGAETEKPGPLPPASARAAWSAALDEVVGKILEHSVERGTIGLGDLFVAALKGMVSSLDEYSAFLDAEDYQQLESTQLGVHWGLGAQIAKLERGASLVVIKCHGGGPARRAGLRTGDTILEVNGVPTAKTPIEDIKRLTAGAPGTEVHLRVRRWNEATPRVLSVTRGEVEVPSLRSALLPEGIGYIQILRFGPGTAQEFERILDDLDGRGLNAAIIDLRGNPGGRLEEAVRVVDLFVGERPQPIVKETGPAGGEEWFREWFPHAGEKPYHPMLILVDAATASSAEVVAGALQDYRRATIVGRRTFGKGAKQTSLPLSPALNRLLGGQGRLLLTTSYLVLPLGRPIQADPSTGRRSRPAATGGVLPDIVLGEDEDRVDEKTEAERLRVQFHPMVSAFIAQRFAGIQALFEAQRPWDPAAEEGFEKLVESLESRLGWAEIRRAVRTAAHRYAEEEVEDAESVGNYREDPELARSILEALRRLGRDPTEVPAYDGLLDPAR